MTRGSSRIRVVVVATLAVCVLGPGLLHPRYPLPYLLGHDRESLQSSFSISKSITSTDLAEPLEPDAYDCTELFFFVAERLFQGARA